jgi:uncharacterized damage-inducible protein DinB
MALLQDQLRALVQHMEWADAETWKAALKVEAAARDARLLDRLQHLHTVQQVYQQVWRGEGKDVPAAGSFADLGVLLAWARPGYAGLRAFVEALDAEGLGRPVRFPWAAEIEKRYGAAGPATVGESILQVVLHTTYHRGQVATRVRELGGEPPTTDFILWIWRGRPAPAW